MFGRIYFINFEMDFIKIENLRTLSKILEKEVEKRSLVFDTLFWICKNFQPIRIEAVFLQAFRDMFIHFTSHVEVFCSFDMYSKNGIRTFYNCPEINEKI